MIWLTRKQVRLAALTSPQAAAYCSMIHWNQILEAGPKEFMSGDVDYGSDYCAICQLMYLSNKKGTCPLNTKCCKDRMQCMICCQEYHAAVVAMRCDLNTEGNVGEPQDEWYDHTKVIIRALIERIRDVLQGM